MQQMSLKEVLAGRRGGPGQAVIHCASGLNDQEQNPLDSARRDDQSSAKNVKIARRAAGKPANKQVHNLDLINCLPPQESSVAALESLPARDNQEDGK